MKKRQTELKDPWVTEILQTLESNSKNKAYTSFLKSIMREENKIRNIGFDVRIAVISGPDYYNNLKNYLEQQQQPS